MVAMISWFKTDQISYFRYMYFSSTSVIPEKNWKLKVRITYQIAFCNNYNVFVDILPLHLRFVKVITIENWGEDFEILCKQNVLHFLPEKLNMLHFVSASAILKFLIFNKNIWKGVKQRHLEGEIIPSESNTERQGRSDTWEININIDHHNNISIESLLHECYGLRT